MNHLESRHSGRGPSTVPESRPHDDVSAPDPRFHTLASNAEVTAFEDGPPVENEFGRARTAV